MPESDHRDWEYDREINPLEYAGFCYRITNLITGKMYIGRKYLTKTSKGKPAGESNWRRYWGSSKELLADIKALGKEQFRREILGFYRSRAETNFMEVELQFKAEVLRARLPDGTQAYYNNSIMGRFYRDFVP